MAGRRKWTDEEREAARQRYWERVNGNKESDKVAEDNGDSASTQAVPPVAQETPPMPQTTHRDGYIANEQEDVAQLLRHALEAIAHLTGKQSQGVPEVVNGKLTGTVDRFSTKKSDYTDFTARLAEEPALKRFGFKENFELTYRYEVIRYQTIDKIWMQEPKITIDLNRKIYDENTGELTNGRYKEFRIVIHEDPDTALWVARQNGIDVPDNPEDERTFLNEMRYLQVRDWLFECFLPKKPTSNNNRREMVVNGKLVEYFETNSENTAKLPFDQLNTKL